MPQKAKDIIFMLVLNAHLCGGVCFAGYRFFGMNKEMMKVWGLGCFFVWCLFDLYHILRDES